MPHVEQHETFDQWLGALYHEGQKGFWGDTPAYAVSLLKSYFGDAATADNDYCYGLMPRLTGDHGTYRQVLDMIDGKIAGYFLLGQNPAVGSAHGKAQRLGMANLDWLVVRDLFEIESANFWRSGPEIDSGEIVTEQCRTEVFLIPAASHVEKEGPHPDPADDPVAREGPGPAGRRPLGAVVLLPPGPDHPQQTGPLHRRSGPGHPGPGLGLSRAR